MKIVCDTNVLISAFLFGGRPREVLRTVIEGKNTAYLSPMLRCELAEVLGRKKFGLTSSQVVSIMQLVSETFLEVFPGKVPDVVAEDPDDNHVIACAFAANADRIVTGDTHLLDLAEYQGIVIQSPEVFLQSMGT